ncbi:MAG: ABC transporter ATP-binding protein [Bryobacteraceae bacterium]|jgi:ABC-2 type transport system ATP-binding protein
MHPRTVRLFAVTMGIRMLPQNGSAIVVEGLRKSYGALEAVRGIDFEVRTGEVFGLLGPNGAGKTTTVEILEGLRRRTSGDVRVLGYDPGIEVRSLKQRIGVCLQATNLPAKIKVHEALDLFAAFYSRRVDTAQLLKRLQLDEKSDTQYAKLSGGQKQRVALALALVNDPTLLFLDEPTTGLDPQVRLEIHKLVEELKAANRTIVLTTHYIEEAERLCDRVAIVDEGRIIAMGTPREIQARTLGHSQIEIETEQPLPAETPPFLAELKHHVADGRKQMSVQSAQPARTIVDLVKWVDQNGIELADIHLKRPTLEDVFIELTGKRLRE